MVPFVAGKDLEAKESNVSYPQLIPSNLCFILSVSPILAFVPKGHALFR